MKSRRKEEKTRKEVNPVKLTMVLTFGKIVPATQRTEAKATEAALDSTETLAEASIGIWSQLSTETMPKEEALGEEALQTRVL